MELILIESVDNVGAKGDVVTVRDGYARNFLLPRKLALAATRANQNFVEEQRARALKRQEKERAEAQKKVNELEQVKLTLEAEVGEEDKLYGSITAEDIKTALADKGHKYDKRKIQLKESIRSLGTHTVVIEIYPQVKASVSVEVIRKS